MPDRLDVAVVGAGPYGLSVAAHLRGLRCRVFGSPMETWRTRMPQDMRLRSAWEETSLSAPRDRGTIDAWAAATREPRREPIDLPTFLRYAGWFAETFVDEADPADVAQVEEADGGFRITTTAGAEAFARRLVLAVGVVPFANAPPPFDAHLNGRVSLAVERRELDDLRGRRLAIVGGGQSALDAAALAVEAGVETELLVRSRLHWFADREPHYERGALARRLYRLAYPAVGYGPPPLNRLVLHPDLFARLPVSWRLRLTRRLLRAGASPAVHGRIRGEVRVLENTVVRGVCETGGGVRLELADGQTREADHVIVAAGYRFALERLDFLAPSLRGQIATQHAWPAIDDQFASTSRPDVFFVGFAAEGRFGPVSRYVLGTRFTATRAAERLRA
jgi:cation diffusion facilitator CzcD-associated flavoprotein CzcO